MKSPEIKKRLKEALAQVDRDDGTLLQADASERCIVGRLAIQLQRLFPEFVVDVEYNRDSAAPKQFPKRMPRSTGNGRRVFPDVVIHQRGPAGPNLLVLEVKKTTNREALGSDQRRVQSFIDQYGYRYGALILCETRRAHERGITLAKWFEERPRRPEPDGG